MDPMAEDTKYTLRARCDGSGGLAVHRRVVLVAVACLLAGCSDADSGKRPTQTTVPAEGEAPMLAERVRRGLLPPVEERMPRRVNVEGPTMGKP